MTGSPGCAALSAAAIRRAGADAVALEERPRQRARPGVEQLDDLGAGLDLRRAGSAMVASVIRSISASKVAGIAVEQLARRRLVGRAAPGDHVGRDRPGRAGEADQRHVAAGSAARTARTVS